MTLVRRAQRNATGPFVVDADALPQTIDVVRTRAEGMGIEVVVADLTDGLPEGELCGVLVQYPGASGAVRDPRAVIDAAHERGALAVVAADILALALLEAPGTFGADVVVGSSQRFGVPLFYGGPHAGFMSVSKGLERHLPGRLVGVSVDAEGRRAYRLALQTREQHIRRDKATSNICTAQVLLAVVASMYAVYHGPDGLRRIAQRTHDHASRIAAALRAGGVDVVNDTWFDTLTVSVPGRAAEVVAAARTVGLHLRLIDEDHVGLSTSERTSPATVGAVLRAFGVPSGTDDVPSGLPDELRRTTEFLTHEVFNSHHSETQMLRYLHKLSSRDYALDRGMIPLGSCTMKLNATTEMEPISLPGFADLHPFAPAQDATGYRELVDDVERWLAEVTGYDRVSVQPNAGSQGELAGLLAIRGYHRANGDTGRDVCLIPSSAHGTNAASAVMAGMKVVVVKASDDGSVDLDDLLAKCDQHAETLAAIMVTYPSTHGAYEDSITDLCKIVHDHGGQVYVDGANLNALLGFARPGEFGGDVSHLNLHKTFCIPHGGGGPGVGPVAVRAHLAPYLPSHACAPGGREAPGHRCDQRGAVRLGGHPADHLGLHPDDGWTRPDPRDRGRRAVGQLHRAPPRGALPGALPRPRRPRRPRVHPRPARDQQGERRQRRRRRQAARRLRLPRPDDVVPGRRDADGGAHRVRGPRGDRPLLRRDDRHPRRDRPRRGGGVDAGGLAAAPRAAHGSRPRRRLGPLLHPRARGLPAGHRPRQVLAAGGAHRPGVRRPQPRLRLPAAGGVRRELTGTRVCSMSDQRQRLLDVAQAEGRLTSVVGAVFDRYGAVWAGGAGDAPGLDGQYRIGSITKTMTAVLVMQARDAGLLDLDDPLSTHLGEVGYGEVTVREALGHASGMQSEPRGPWWERTRGRDFAALAAANDGSGRVAGAGEWFHYSNLGYGLLGEVVARRFGAPWRELVNDRLFRPLAMRSTSYLPRPGAQPGWSVDHFTGIRVHEPLTETGAMAPAGQLWSTLADLVTWGQVLGGAHPEVVAPATLAEMGRAVAARLRPRPDARRAPGRSARGARRLDAGLHGLAARGPRQRDRRGGADQRHDRHRPAGAGRLADRGRPGRLGRATCALAPTTVAARRTCSACRACGSGATRPTTCAGTTRASRCG